jgi:RHS repeat-associated protein
LFIYESGVRHGCPGSFTTGDIIRIAVESGVVVYKKNGTTFYTSSVSPTYPLNADAALYSNTSTINNVKISGALTSSGPGTVHWLVADQLGTPRMILDQSGSLANVKRHDYLPFGEEIASSISGRSGYGYGGGDGVRQEFTSKERDNETGLDYFGARYYSSTQGRFTSPDLLSGRPGSPQSWNSYTYSINNPLKYVDPDGLWWYTKDGGDGHPEWFDDDPGKGYTRFTQYAYYGGAANGYVALDPYSKIF